LSVNIFIIILFVVTKKVTALCDDWQQLLVKISMSMVLTFLL